MSTTAKDLTKEAPISAGHRTGGYVILSRLADKARAAFMGGNVGEYHTDCPLDHMLLDWKGVSYDEVKQEIVNGATDDQLVSYLGAHGNEKTPEEIKTWSDSLSNMRPYDSPEKREWFTAETAKMGLEPTVTMFAWLNEGDKEVTAK